MYRHYWEPTTENSVEMVTTLVSVSLTRRFAQKTPTWDQGAKRRLLAIFSYAHMVNLEDSSPRGTGVPSGGE